MQYAPVVIPLAILFLLSVFVIANYNRFARVRQHLLESWSDIDVEMRRRYELIPNLLACVKGYAAHEKEVLGEIARLRTRASESHGTPTQQAWTRRHWRSA